MKNLLKIASLFVLIFTINSCSTDDKVIDGIFSDVSNGAILRTINLVSGEYAIGATDPFFAVEFEEQDAQDGALLSSVDVYVSFKDDSAGTTSAEVLYSTIPAADFSSATPFGLPRTTLNITLDQMLAANGIVAGDIFGGDTFPVRLALNLTDGRTFSVDNATGIISGGFFSSPFLYNVNVVCAIPDTYMLGDYAMLRTSTVEDPFFPNYGQAFSSTVPQTVTVGGMGASRNFDFSYFPTSFDFGQRMTITLSCGNIFIAGTSIGGTLGCDGTTIQQSTGPMPSQYDLANDTAMSIDFLDFEPDAGCGTGNYPVTILLTKL